MITVTHTCSKISGLLGERFDFRFLNREAEAMATNFLGSLCEAATTSTSLWHFVRVVAAVIRLYELGALSTVAVVFTTLEAMLAFVVPVAVTISFCNVPASIRFTIAKGISGSSGNSSYESEYRESHVFKFCFVLISN